MVEILHAQVVQMAIFPYFYRKTVCFGITDFLRLEVS